MALGRSGGILPRKVFKNLDTVMAILPLFEQFLWQILFNFFASNSQSFTKYDKQTNKQTTEVIFKLY